MVFFSNLPRENEKKMELLTICRRFGTVEKHLFLNDAVKGSSVTYFNSSLHFASYFFLNILAIAFYAGINYFSFHRHLCK